LFAGVSPRTIKEKNLMRMSKLICGALILIVFGVIEAKAIEQSICSSEANEILYPNGSLKSCVLKDTYRSNDIKCKSQSSASFYENGQLDTCVLAETSTISGQKCKEFGVISFYADGKLRSCVKTD
jgi:hypothetical protein